MSMPCCFSNTGRAKVAAAGFCMQLALGAVYGWSVFLTPLQQHFNASKVATNLTFTITLAVLGIARRCAGIEPWASDDRILDNSRPARHRVSESDWLSRSATKTRPTGTPNFYRAVRANLPHRALASTQRQRGGGCGRGPCNGTATSGAVHLATSDTLEIAGRARRLCRDRVEEKGGTCHCQHRERKTTIRSHSASPFTDRRCRHP